MRKFKVLALSVCLCIALSGCDYLPFDSEPVQYKNEFIEFAYPGNWSLEEGDVPGTLQYIIVGGPSSTQVVVQIYPRESALSLTDYAEWFSEVFSDSLPFGETDAVTFTPVSSALGPDTVEGVREKFALRVIGIEVPHVRDYFAILGEQKIIYLVFQTAADGKELWGEKIVKIKESFVFN